MSENANFDINCPNCKKWLRVHRTMAGKRLRCPNQGCGFTIDVPEVETDVTEREPPDTYQLQEISAEDRAEEERAKFVDRFNKKGVRAARSLKVHKGTLAFDEEYDALGLPSEKKSLAWEARAKIMWGEPVKNVQAWLVVLGFDRFSAKRIVAVAVREQAKAFRVRMAWELVPGILLSAGAAAGLIYGKMNGWFAEDDLVREVPSSVGYCVILLSIFGCFLGPGLILKGLTRLFAGPVRDDQAVEDFESSWPGG